MNLTSSEISTLMKCESPVFIVGVPRSGTSVLYRTLMRQSSFKPKNYRDESGINIAAESRVFRDPYGTYFTSSSNVFGYQLSGSNSPIINYMLGNEECYNQFLESTQWIQKRQKLLIGKYIYQKISGHLNLDRLKIIMWKATLNDHLIRIFFYYAKQARGMERILEKTPQHICHLPEIKQTFPNVKFIFMYRHPVDVFSSYKMRLKASIERGMQESHIRWLKISPREFCNTYARYVQLALKEQTSNPCRLMLLKYENLTSNPQAELNRVFDFLGEIIEPEEETVIFRKASEKEAKRKKIRLSSNSPITTNQKNWQDSLGEHDARFIEDKLSKIMHDLDYERYT